MNRPYPGKPKPGLFCKITFRAPAFCVLRDPIDFFLGEISGSLKKSRIRETLNLLNDANSSTAAGKKNFFWGLETLVKEYIAYLAKLRFSFFFRFENYFELRFLVKYAGSPRQNVCLGKPAHCALCGS